MKNKQIFTLFAGLLTLGLGASAAHADAVTITLNSSPISVAPGGTVTFSGNVFAPVAGNSGTVYLNGDGFNFYGNGTVDSANGGDDPFLDNFFSLSPGGSQSGDLFTVTIGADATAGLINGNFEVQGGTTVNSFDDLGSVNFAVNVVTPSAATPEPPAWLLLATGGIGMLGLSRKRAWPNRMVTSA
jgi:hypothetical protein